MGFFPIVLNSSIKHLFKFIVCIEILKKKLKIQSQQIYYVYNHFNKVFPILYGYNKYQGDLRAISAKIQNEKINSIRKKSYDFIIIVI